MNAMIAAIVMLTAGASTGSSRVLVADIALSEFTAPLRLTLDLDSGVYAAVLPDSVRPSPYPQPQPRHGTLAGESLDKVRRAFDRAAQSGLTHRDCSQGNLQPKQIIITNAPVPFLKIYADERILTAPTEWSCFTPAALALQRSVDRL